jgi:hypothetical protein
MTAAVFGLADGMTTRMFFFEKKNQKTFAQGRLPQAGAATALSRSLA